MGTFASSMVGSVVGHVVADKLLGGNKSENNSNTHDNEDSHDEEEAVDCRSQELEFQDCLKQNNSDIQRCQFFFDVYQQCKVDKFNKNKF
jgi:hypothetical protein